MQSHSLKFFPFSQNTKKNPSQGSLSSASPDSCNPVLSGLSPMSAHALGFSHRGLLLIPHTCDSHCHHRTFAHAVLTGTVSTPSLHCFPYLVNFSSFMADLHLHFTSQYLPDLTDYLRPTSETLLHHQGLDKDKATEALRMYSFSKSSKYGRYKTLTESRTSNHHVILSRFRGHNEVMRNVYHSFF